MNNALYERAKKFANTNVIGNCGELECLAEMLYEFAEQETKDLEAQIEKMKSDVVSERDKAEHLEDVITYIVLNDILEKWEIKENDKSN